MILYSNLHYSACFPIMTYSDLPVIILLLASGYLLTIYVLLSLAQRTAKGGRYVGNSLAEGTLPEGFHTMRSLDSSPSYHSLRVTGTPTAYSRASEGHLTEVIHPKVYVSTGLREDAPTT